MATTPNYGWVTPAPTDFVTDLPADFETFADAVDADLAGLLGGTTGQVLTKDSNTDHDFSWVTPSASSDNFTLLNTGGTSLTGAQTVTVSGISGKSKLWIIVDTASAANSGSFISIRVNGDSTNNYRWGGFRISPDQTYTTSMVSNDQGIDSEITLFAISNAARSGSGYVSLIGCDGTGAKAFTSAGGTFRISGDSDVSYNFTLGGVYLGTSPITSVSVFSSSGNLDAGTLYIYGA